jgi:hypothetical protein
MSEMVQPILVVMDNDTIPCHEDVITGVCLASLHSYLGSPQFDPNQRVDNWAEWLSGRFTKSVRRVKPNGIDAILSEDPYHVADIAVNDVTRVIGMVPRPYEEFSKKLSRTRVSGLDLERTKRIGWAHRRRVGAQGPTLMINSSIEMSTGKMAAQCAHAVFAWLLNATPDRVDNWIANECPMTFAYAPQGEIEYLSSSGWDAIVDSGLTEIEPNTTTVVYKG